MTIQDLHILFLKCNSISIDTRNIKKKSLFIALRGERFDANTFTKEALNNGAEYVVIDNKEYYIDERTILVDNSLIALQELAKFHRKFLNIPIIALTGSNGKTTTKELINVVLSKKFNAKATVGNLNNHIGVPLTLLSFDTSTQIGIVEMGANHQKEIEFLCTIALPDFGYITNFGKAHLEGFGGVEGVIKGKSEMYDYLENNNKTAFVNLDDSIQKEKTKDINCISFSNSDTSATLLITNSIANPFVSVAYKDIEIHSHLIGLYNATNINAAMLIGNYFGVSDLQIKEAIENYLPTNNRSQLIHKNSSEIILDAYNANPSSMKLALENFIQLEKSNKIIVLGDMFELGVESQKEHKYIVDLLKNKTNIIVFFVGNYFYESKINIENFHFFSNYDDFSQFFKTITIKNSLLLIKGSRGMALERTLELL